MLPSVAANTGFLTNSPPTSSVNGGNPLTSGFDDEKPTLGGVLPAAIVAVVLVSGPGILSVSNNPLSTSSLLIILPSLL